MTKPLPPVASAPHAIILPANNRPGHRPPFTTPPNGPHGARWHSVRLSSSASANSPGVGFDSTATVDTIALRRGQMPPRAHSSAWLERIPDKDEVPGSNPGGPTKGTQLSANAATCAPHGPAAAATFAQLGQLDRFKSRWAHKLSLAPALLHAHHMEQAAARRRLPDSATA